MEPFRWILRIRLQFVQWILLTSLPGSYQGQHERRLLKDLLENSGYDELERPVVNESHSLVVKFGMTLQQIIDVDEKNQILTSNVWLNVVWNDYNLRWNESEYGNVTSIRLPAKRIWKPDILMYNSADEDIDSTFHTNIVVSSSGDCLWVPPGLFLSTCTIDITWFPFDDQKCPMKFGSWTYTSDGIDLQLQYDTGDTTSFMKNGEWELIGVPARRNVISYECCPENYIDITFTIHIRRRTLYYGFNLIIPCVLISSMALLAFTLPPDSGEKISLGVTILLSLTVFLLLVAETMPPTSDAVPLIGMYFACIMLMCSLSVVFTVLVLNYHHRSPDTHEMPKWVKKGVCEWLAWLLRMKRPGKDLSRQRLLNNSRMRDVELKDRSSRSLLANVLDLDDDFRGATLQSMNSSSSNHNCTRPTSKVGNYTFNNVNSFVANHLDNFSTPQDNCDAPAAANTPVYKEILKELKFLTDKIKRDEDFQERCTDWKFAALVIDRLCLWLFTTFTIVSTCAILFSAPNVFT